MDHSIINGISKYFESLEPRFDLFFATDKGVFLGGAIKPIFQALKQLKDEGIIRERQTFLDAGSGDGRILAIAVAGKLKAHGIECNEIILEASRENMKKLIDLKLIDREPVTVLGDFLENSTYYEALQMPFSSFEVIYTFETCPLELAEKISTDSRKNTVFLYHSLKNEPVLVKRLELLKTMDLANHQYLHVYKKA
ncbi:MAG: hypothetical protein ACFFD4_10420 [Candidatus Odinarchaeota archaeon]